MIHRSLALSLMAATATAGGFVEASHTDPTRAKNNMPTQRTIDQSVAGLIITPDRHVAEASAARREAIIQMGFELMKS